MMNTQFLSKMIGVLTSLCALAFFALTATTAPAQTWPPAYGDHFSNNTFYPWWQSPTNPGAGVTVTWYSTIHDSGYTNSTTPPPTSDSTDTLSDYFDKDFYPSPDPTEPEFDYILQKNEALILPTLPLSASNPCSGTAIAALDQNPPPSGDVYEPTSLDTYGLYRYIKLWANATNMISVSSSPSVTAYSGASYSAPYTAFVFKVVVNNPPSGYTIHIARGYSIYGQVSCSGAVVFSAGTTIAATPGNVNLTEGHPYGSTNITAGTDSTVTLASTQSTPYYIVVPAWAVMTLSIGNNVSPDGSGGLNATGQSIYQIKVYDVTHN